MSRWLRKASLIAAIGVGLGAGSILGPSMVLRAGQSDSQTTADEFQNSVLLAKNCLGCHNDRLHTGNLSLEPFRDAALAPQESDIWRKVLERLTAGQMPPRPMAPLSPVDLSAVTTWIRKLPGVSDAPHAFSSFVEARPGLWGKRHPSRTSWRSTRDASRCAV